MNEIVSQSNYKILYSYIICGNIYNKSVLHKNILHICAYSKILKTSKVMHAMLLMKINKQLNIDLNAI